MPIKLNGSTSGYVELAAPAIAGTTTLTLPTTSGTLIVANGAQTIEFADGSNTAPSITNSGDTNTGIFFPAADTIAFTEGGVESMRIDSSGNVGIGTSSPTAKFDVVGPIVSHAALPTNQTAASVFDYYADTARIISYGSGATVAGFDLLCGAANSAPSLRMRLDSNGNLGIGPILSPAYRIDAYVAANSFQIVNQLRNDNQGTGVAAIGFNVASSGLAETSVPKSAIGLVRSSAQGVGFLAFYLDGSTDTNPVSTADERMRITETGEVFIAGTTDRGVYNLQCNGTGVWGAGAYVNGSDERIKDDIQPIGSCLNIVESLNPVTFKYKESWSKDQSIQPGFIAQELQTALTGQVYTDGVVQQGPEYMSVAYQALIPMLTKAIQELSAKVDAQAAEIAALKGGAA